MTTMATRLFRASGLLLFAAAMACGAPALTQELEQLEGTMMRGGLAGSLRPGKLIDVPVSEYTYAPTALQLAAHEQLLAAKARHVAPPIESHTTLLQVANKGGEPTFPMTPEANTTFTVFTESLINSTCSGCAQSTVNEPSVANSGKDVLETSNWNIAY